MGRKDKPIAERNTVGAQLRIARQDKGISLTKMADKLGYTIGHLSGVENGRGQPSQYLLQGYEQELKLQSGQLCKLRTKDTCKKVIE